MTTEHDLQLLTAGQTTEYLARLLGAAVNQLGGTIVVTAGELASLNGKDLEHGLDPESGAYALRLVDKEPAVTSEGGDPD